jgi:hypothetical protein
MYSFLPVALVFGRPHSSDRILELVPAALLFRTDFAQLPCQKAAQSTSPLTLIGALIRTRQNDLPIFLNEIFACLQAELHIAPTVCQYAIHMQLYNSDLMAH